MVKVERTPTMIRLSDDERAWLREVAEAEDRTMASQIRWLIKEGRERRDAAAKLRVKEMS